MNYLHANFNCVTNELHPRVKTEWLAKLLILCDLFKLVLKQTQCNGN